mmetsp:Transcript_40824/g.85573  ORF Transcript_40824/g.85573 Transcript_40824/m.85573 type:complete len:96 (-) Transcript_40824:911-1198(-)
MALVLKLKCARTEIALTFWKEMFIPQIKRKCDTQGFSKFEFIDKSQKYYSLSLSPSYTYSPTWTKTRDVILMCAYCKVKETVSILKLNEKYVRHD